MKKHIAFILFMVSPFLFAQGETKYHLISLKNEKDVPYEFPFWIDKVYDGRQFKENIGTVQKGAFNRKILANLEQPFVQELQDYMKVAYPRHEKSRKIDIRIHDLYVSELTESTRETGYASIVFDVIENRDNIDYIVGTYAGTVEGNGMDVTGKHDERIKLAIQKCVNQYNNMAEADKSARVFDPNEPVNKNLSGVPKKGVYVSYADALNNKPFIEEDFVITNKDAKYYIFKGANRVSLQNYFGFSDGTDFYINTSKFTKDKYFAKSEIIGNKYYIGDIISKNYDVVSWGVMFGVTGVIVAQSMNEPIPVLIDSFSGQPVFLSNATMKTMLAPYPELLKEFRQSKKSDDDKKNILKKYYALAVKP